MPVRLLFVTDHGELVDPAVEPRPRPSSTPTVITEQGPNSTRGLGRRPRRAGLSPATGNDPATTSVHTTERGTREHHRTRARLSASRRCERSWRPRIGSRSRLADRNRCGLYHANAAGLVHEVDRKSRRAARIGRNAANRTRTRARRRIARGSGANAERRASSDERRATSVERRAPDGRARRPPQASRPHGETAQPSDSRETSRPQSSCGGGGGAWRRNR